MRWLVAAALTILASPALAHDAPYSFLNLRFAAATRLEGTLTAHVVDLAHELAAAPESLLAPAAATREGPALFARLSKRFSIVGDGGPLDLRFVSAAPDSERNGITMRFAAATSALPSQVAIEARLFPYDPAHETYVNAYVGDVLRTQDLIDARHPRIAFETGAPPPVAAVLSRFVAAGVHHIFIGPDHILFVIGLLLLGGSVRRLLEIVTGFTVAHSITLALATLGGVTPPARVVEPLIALSIVFIGMENLRALRRGPAAARDHRALLAFVFGFVHGFGFASVLREFGLPEHALGWVTPPARVIEPLIALSIVFIGMENLRALKRVPSGDRDHRALLAFVFGFVHGFGFASVLREFGLPEQALGAALFAFNGGVELGQAAIVLATAPVLTLVRRMSARAGLRVTYTGSAVVGLAGLVWFVERVNQ